MLNGIEKIFFFIIDYREYYIDIIVKFVVKMIEEKLVEVERVGLYKVFKF